jgi:Ca2+-binding RTX toxin-like protein
MAIRSFTGYLNSDLFGGEFPDDFTVPVGGLTGEIDILISDGLSDLVVEGDSDGGSNSTEDSEDAEGDQFVFARDSNGDIIFDGETFYLESSFVFEINGQQFTGYHFEEDSGGGSVDFTILPPNLPAGNATIISTNFTPSPDEVPYDLLTSGDEEIDETGYNNLDLSGDDTIIAGDGDDTIKGGAGDDIIDGGDGDDIISGDELAASLDYGDIPDPDLSGTAIDDGDDVSDGFTLTSGNVDVTYSFSEASPGPTDVDFEFNNSETQYTDGLNNGGATSNNSIYLGGSGGDSGTSTTTISFDSADASVQGEVQNVNFRINDIDDSSWQDIIKVTAINAAGESVEITFTAGANMTAQPDTDGDGFIDTFIANDGTGNQNPSTASASLLVEIAGPVKSITIEYGNLDAGGQRIDLTEVYFEPIAVEGADGFDDEIDGGAGDDTIFGNQGDDILDGGSDVDSIDGGTGEDTILISSGTDTIDGGDGEDTFTAIGGSSLTDETITVVVDDAGDGTIAKTNDGTTDSVTSVETYIADEAPEEADRITITTADLTAVDIMGIDDTATGTYTSTNGSFVVDFGGVGEPTLSEILAGTYVLPGGATVSGTGSFAIDGGDEDGQIRNIKFENFENIDFSIVCFADGTLIKTDQGLVAVETLTPGDVVVTVDSGPQPIRWTGSTKIDAASLARNPRLQPIRIKAGALAPQMPARDLVVSPQHRILVRSNIAIRMFDASEVFVPAKHLLGLPGVEVATDLQSVIYVHIMCDNHEIIEAEGALAETLYTGTEALKAMTDDARQEIDAIFGDLPYLNRPLARVTPRGKRAKRLIERHVKNDKQLYQ